MLTTISININNKAKKNTVLPGINSMKNSKKRMKVPKKNVIQLY